MDVKKFLKDLSKIQVLIKSKTELIKLLNSKAEYKGISYGEDTSGSGTSDHMDLIMEVLDKEKELKEAIDNYSKMLTDAMEIIDKLENPRYIQVLYKRYLQNKRWENIAVELDRDLRQIYRMHGEALVELQKICENDKKYQ